MELSDFHKCVLARADHRLLTTDIEGYGFLGEDIFSSFESFLSASDRDQFLQKLQQGDHEWFLVNMHHEDGDHLVFLRVTEETDQEYIHLQMADALALIHGHRLQTKWLEAYEAMGGLTDNAFFYYDPTSGMIHLHSRTPMLFRNGLRTLDEFEEELIANTPKAEQERARAIIQDIRQMTGRFEHVILANILTGNTDFMRTYVTGCRVYHKEGTEAVAGMIHITAGGGDSSSIATGFQRDTLTGLLSRDEILKQVKKRITGEGDQKGVLVMLDIDYFKDVNDTYGHQQGDNVLAQVAAIVQTELGLGGYAGRFGGDEFMLLLFDPDMASVRTILGNIKNMVRASFPNMGPGGDQPITVSIGSAEFPRYSSDYEDVFTIADYCLYLAKAKGRNRFITYIPEKHGTLEMIKASGMVSDKLNEREETSPGDMIAEMMYRAKYGKQPQLQLILNEFSKRFEIPSLFVLAGEPYEIVGTAGVEPITDGALRRNVVCFVNSHLEEMGPSDFVVVNVLESLPSSISDVRDYLEEKGILSFLYIKFTADDGTQGLVAMMSNGKKKQWNQQQFKYYRLFTDVLTKYHLAHQ